MTTHVGSELCMNNHEYIHNGRLIENSFKSKQNQFSGNTVIMYLQSPNILINLLMYMGLYLGWFGQWWQIDQCIAWKFNPLTPRTNYNIIRLLFG